MLAKTKTGTKTPALTDRMFSAAPYLSAVPHENENAHRPMHVPGCTEGSYVSAVNSVFFDT